MEITVMGHIGFNVYLLLQGLTEFGLHRLELTDWELGSGFHNP